VEILLRDLRRERQLAQPVAIQRKEVRLVVFRAIENRGLVEKEISGSGCQREAVGLSGGAALFVQPLVRLAKRSTGRGIEPQGGEWFLDLHSKLANGFDRRAHGRLLRM